MLPWHVFRKPPPFSPAGCVQAHASAPCVRTFAQLAQQLAQRAVGLVPLQPIFHRRHGLRDQLSSVRAASHFAFCRCGYRGHSWYDQISRVIKNDSRERNRPLKSWHVESDFPTVPFKNTKQNVSKTWHNTL